MIRTFKYRLLPSKPQHAGLRKTLEDQRQLYNAALEERIGCYRATGKGRSYFDQSHSLKEMRRDDPAMAAVPHSLQRWTLKRLADAYASFFRRLKASQHPGFPRFRSMARWDSFGMRDMDGLRFDGRRIHLKGLAGSIRIHLHRPLPSGSNIRGCVFQRDGKGWSICFLVAEDAPEKRPVARSVGIDLGIISLAHLSDGVIIPNPRHARRAEREMRRRQRALTRCKRGSQRRHKMRQRLAKQHAKIANTRATYLHQQSARIVRSYDLIAVEALNIKGLARTNLARSVHDASWGTFLAMLRYKAEGAGAHFIEVDPRYTSQDCSGCGARVRKTLAQRTHSCPECGVILDRDENAALNVLHKAVTGLGLAKLSQVRV